MQDITGLIEELPKRKLKSILANPEKTAEAVNLVYVNDTDNKGITRKKSGKSFKYYLQNKQIRLTIHNSERKGKVSQRKIFIESNV